MILEAVFNSWKIIIDVYRDLFFPENKQINKGGQSNEATIETVRKAKKILKHIDLNIFEDSLIKILNTNQRKRPLTPKLNIKPSPRPMPPELRQIKL